MSSLLIKNGTLITMNPGREVLAGDLYVENGRIVEIPASRHKAEQVIDATDKLVLPGLVQIHVHLNQTLFRGLADDMDVVDWLRLRIWPLEQAHTPESVYASARLSIAEMIRGGTTTALTIETTNHTEAAFQAAQEMGFRATIGNAMMDRWEIGTEMIGDDTQTALEKSVELLDNYHGKADGRLRYALTPRGVRNATDELWKEVVRLAKEHNVLIHTHAAENRQQSERLATLGSREVEYLGEMGALGRNLVIAHCVWLSAQELDLMAKAGANVAHCPSANLKLASGFAPVPEMLDKGINVALGGDGAPCNNNLDAFVEMRLAALIHKPRVGPKALPAEKVLEMMTMGGARALGLEREIGSLEAGKRADITILSRNVLNAWPSLATDPVSQVVYAHQSRDVHTVVIGGEVLLSEGQFVRWSQEDVLRDAQGERKKLLERVPELGLG